MAYNISFRDVTFNPAANTVTISVITDVPCHLYCRLTTTEPQIHTKSILRRGEPFMSELRFCFVSYEDNEQTEEGDTTTHTWVKPDWPFCTTKWVYFWGYVSGELSPSTSPVFKYHNDYEVVHFPGEFCGLRDSWQPAACNWEEISHMYHMNNIWVYLFRVDFNLRVMTVIIDPDTGLITYSSPSGLIAISGLVTGVSGLLRISQNVYCIFYRVSATTTYNYAHTFYIEDDGTWGGTLLQKMMFTGTTRGFSFRNEDPQTLSEGVYFTFNSDWRSSARLCIRTWHITADGLSILNPYVDTTIITGAKMFLACTHNVSGRWIIWNHRSIYDSMAVAYGFASDGFPTYYGVTYFQTGGGGTDCTYISACKLSDRYHAVAYKIFTPETFRVRTFKCDQLGFITDIIDENDLLFGKKNVYQLKDISGDVYSLAYGDMWESWLKTLHISSEGVIGPVIDMMSFANQRVIKILPLASSDYFAGAGAVTGWMAVVQSICMYS